MAPGSTRLGFFVIYLTVLFQLHKLYNIGSNGRGVRDELEGM
jgi:hypothetical protein